MNVKHLISLHSGGVMPPFVCVSFLIFPLDNNSWGQIVCLIVLSLSPSMKVVWPRSSPYSNLHPSSLFHIFAKNNFTKYFTNRNKKDISSSSPFSNLHPSSLFHIFAKNNFTFSLLHFHKKYFTFTFSPKNISLSLVHIFTKKYLTVSLR